MKAICTSYNQTENGLVLRNNWVDDIRDHYHLNDYLRNFLDRETTDYVYHSIKKAEFKISDIIEGKMDLNNVVIHIRIVS